MAQKVQPHRKDNTHRANDYSGANTGITTGNQINAKKNRLFESKFVRILVIPITDSGLFDNVL